MERYIVKIIKETYGRLDIKAENREQAKEIALKKENIKRIIWSDEDIFVADMTKMPLVCSVCGKEIPDDSIYCNKCGEKIQE